MNHNKQAVGKRYRYIDYNFNINEMEMIHKYFTQYLLQNAFVKMEEALKFLATIKTDITMADLHEIIAELNQQITRQNFKIVHTTCEVTGNEWLIFTNLQNDELSRKHAGFSAIELEYFHTILKEIVSATEDHNNLYSIHYSNCLNLTSTLLTCANLSRESGQIVLNKWIGGGYFVKVNEKIVLGPRALREFVTYLREHAPTNVCSLCSELVFQGDSCTSCEKIFHKICLEKYKKRKQKCPNCKIRLNK